MKLKKIPYYFLFSVLTFGASLIIGFLSFTGMFALIPVIPYAISALVLSVGYEGEIYLQNIKGALNKLFFKSDYLKRHLANQYLVKQFTPTKDITVEDCPQLTEPAIDTAAEDCPQFFKDYEAQLKLWHKFTHHKRLNKESTARKKQIEKTLRDMEKWFASQLFPAEEGNLTEYENNLRTWLKANGQNEQNEFLQQQQARYNATKVFSIFSGIFMSFGTSYLLADAFAIFPFFAVFATLPGVIIPLAIIAGAAYAFLIYNSVTDMIHSNSLVKWYNKIMDSEVTPRNLTIAAAAVLLLVLATTLTLFTAGTWWTVVKNTRPLYTWMGKIPNLIASGIAIITGSAQLIFNLQNTCESLDLIDKATKKNFFDEFKKFIEKGFEALGKENWLQRINIPRIILKLTVVPLRLILFFGHLISMGVTADRVPGISETMSALLGIICEGFEDFHYFIGDLLHHDHEHGKDTASLLEQRFGEEHGHDHSTDIPTQAIKFLFTYIIPLYPAAAGWDYLASDDKQLTWDDALAKQTGQPRAKSVTLKATAQKPSSGWQVQHSVYRIDRHIAKHLHQTTSDPNNLAPQKITALQTLRQDLCAMQTPSEEAIKERIQAEATQEIHNKQRHSYSFFEQPDKTRTQAFLEEQLPQRISA